MNSKLLALRMQRQHLVTPLDEAGYDALYRDLQPGMNLSGMALVSRLNVPSVRILTMWNTIVSVRRGAS